MEFGWSDESQDQIMNGSDHFSPIAQSHTSGIFLEGNIAAIMWADFNAPVSGSGLEEASWASFCASEAGDAKFHFGGGAIATSIAPP